LKLAQLQQSFQAHVLRGDPAIALEIAGDARFPEPLRLGVYAEGYAARLVEVLGESYPAVHEALGTRRFNGLVGEFVRRHPSRFRSARDYGEELPQWLESRLSGARARRLADLARFEWAVAGAFDAADQAALAPESLAGTAPGLWPGLHLTFAPSVRRLSLGSNCTAWWKFACAGQPRPGRWRSTGCQQWLVWRRELAVYFRQLKQPEARALDAAIAGVPFGRWCEDLSGPPAAARLLHGWFSEGLVTGVALGSQDP
jgi:Putative DNA-binding domain